jgi:hypothetical protein
MRVHRAGEIRWRNCLRGSLCYLTRSQQKNGHPTAALGERKSPCAALALFLASGHGRKASQSVRTWLRIQNSRLPLMV